MDFIKQNRNRIYLGITIAALVLAVILCIDYSARRKAEKSEAAQTATTRTEKEKKDKVLISVNTGTIRDGLADMGVLITQEYYFTQVETYTKEKNIFLVIPSTSAFTYSYDGAVMAGVDFEKILVETDDRDDGALLRCTFPHRPSEGASLLVDSLLLGIETARRQYGRQFVDYEIKEA
jgi:hypothetical protein